MSFADNKRNTAANDMRHVIDTEEHLPQRGISKINAPPLHIPSTGGGTGWPKRLLRLI